jgi:hypothetical protein
VRVDFLGALGREGLSLLGRIGAPFYMVGFDKTFLALPRLAHALALFYVVSCLPAVTAFAAGRYAEPVKLLGRYGLPVFATGSVLSILFQAVKELTGDNFPADSALLAFGLAVQLGLALALAKTVALHKATATTTRSPSVTEA